MRVPRLVTLLVSMAAMNANATEGLIVAVASNFQSSARAIAAQFTHATGIPIRITSGSTGHLYAQIVNGAPYDVFLAADIERPQLLVTSGAAEADTYAVYATGYLVLWSIDPAYRKESCFEDFKAGRFSRLAIANPETAPYGLAAKRLLRAAGLWDAMTDKLVFGENVSQTFQFAATGNASLGLVAASQVLASESASSTCLVRFSGEFDGAARVSQAGAVLRRSRRPDEARQFMAYLVSQEVRALLSQQGYQ